MFLKAYEGTKTDSCKKAKRECQIVNNRAISTHYHSLVNPRSVDTTEFKELLEDQREDANLTWGKMMFHRVGAMAKKACQIYLDPIRYNSLSGGTVTEFFRAEFDLIETLCSEFIRFQYSRNQRQSISVSEWVLTIVLEHFKLLDAM